MPHTQAAYGGLSLLLLLSILQIKRRGKTSLLQGVVWMAAPFALSSNILFPVGTVVGERLLYLPSAGFCIIIAHALAELVEPGGRTCAGEVQVASTTDSKLSEAANKTTMTRKGASKEDIMGSQMQRTGRLRDRWRIVLANMIAACLCSAYAVVRPELSLSFTSHLPCPTTSPPPTREVSSESQAVGPETVETNLP